jgi:hypothetical protein
LSIRNTVVCPAFGGSRKLVGGDVADRDQRGVVRLEVRPVEPLQVGARDRLHRLLRPGERPAVGVLHAVEDHRVGTVGDRRPAVLQLNELGETLLADAVELLGREGGAQHDVGHERERAVELRGRRVQRHARGVPPAPGVQRDAEERLLVGDLERGAGGRSLVEQGGREVGDPGAIGRVALAARAEEEDKVGERQLVVLDHEELEPVRELARHHRRKRQRRRSAEPRRPRPVDAGDAGHARRRVRPRRVGPHDRLRHRRRHGGRGAGATRGGKRRAERDRYAIRAVHLALSLTAKSRFPAGTTVNTTLGFPR